MPMKKKSLITLKDIAIELDISVSTVSRALKNNKSISDKTKQLVQAKAKELDYYPNVFAQGFRNHTTHMLGVIVPKISHYYTSTILEGILSEAEEKGYHVIIMESKNKYEKQTELLNTMLHLGVDGILLSLTKTTSQIDSITKFIEQVPIVLFDKVSRKISCTQVIIKEEQAAFDAIKHLIDIGRKRIAIFKETENSFNSMRRYEGYLRALRTHNIPVDESLIYSTDNISLENGKKLTTELINSKNNTDAIFCITDNCAVGTIQTLKKHQIKIPQEIAVVGFSNSLVSTIIEPKITTVDQPGNRVGKTAVKYLIEEINNFNEDYMDYKTIEIKTNLIIRGSSMLS